MRRAAGGLFSILLWGAKGSRDVKLPITVGPLKGGEKVRLLCCSSSAKSRGTCTITMLKKSWPPSLQGWLCGAARRCDVSNMEVCCPACALGQLAACESMPCDKACYSSPVPLQLPLPEQTSAHWHLCKCMCTHAGSPRSPLGWMQGCFGCGVGRAARCRCLRHSTADVDHFGARGAGRALPCLLLAAAWRVTWCGRKVAESLHWYERACPLDKIRM